MRPSQPTPVATPTSNAIITTNAPTSIVVKTGLVMKVLIGSIQLELPDAQAPRGYAAPRMRSVT